MRITVVDSTDLPELLSLVRACLARDHAGSAVGFATLYWTWQTLAAARVGATRDDRWLDYDLPVNPSGLVRRRASLSTRARSATAICRSSVKMSSVIVPAEAVRLPRRLARQAPAQKSSA
jgi:hypothetical protein